MLYEVITDGRPVGQAGDRLDAVPEAVPEVQLAPLAALERVRLDEGGLELDRQPDDLAERLAPDPAAPVHGPPHGGEMLAAGYVV